MRLFPETNMDPISLHQDGFLSEQERDMDSAQRVARLELIVCDLLRRNCELRFELAKFEAEAVPDRITED